MNFVGNSSVRLNSFYDNQRTQNLNYSLHKRQTEYDSNKKFKTTIDGIVFNSKSSENDMNKIHIKSIV